MSRLSSLFLIIIFCMMSSACGLGGINLREGIHSFKIQDYRSAFIRLKPEAERGHPEAQYAVGYMYYYGQGVVEDREKAWFWINRAATAGQTDAITAAKMIGPRIVPPGQKVVFQPVRKLGAPPIFVAPPMTRS